MDKKLTRRSALVGGLVASALPVVAHATQELPANLTEKAPRLHPSDPLPESWQEWRGQGVGDTIGDLLSLMDTELSCHTSWSRLEAGVLAAENAAIAPFPPDFRLYLCDRIIYPVNHALNGQWIERSDQAFRFGYALAMTRAASAGGIEAWHRAAMRYAGFAELGAAEDNAANEHLAAVTDENWRLLGYRHIGEAEEA